MPLSQPERSRRGSRRPCVMSGQAVGDRVEDQVDLQPGQVGAEAVVRAGAAEADRCGLGSRVMSNCLRVLEHLLVEVRRARRTCPTRSPFLICYAAELGVRERGALEGGDRRGPADDLVGRGLGTLRLYSSHCSGLSRNACMPWVMALRVVSLPATASIITKKPNSSD